MIYIKLDAGFVTPPPLFQIMLKTPSKTIFVS